MAGSVKMLLRPFAAAACSSKTQLLGQSKFAFLSVAKPQNVILRPVRNWVHVAPVRKVLGVRCFSSQVNDAGSIDSSLMKSMADKIKEQLSAESVIVKDAYGDGRHVSIDVVSSAFEGQSAVNRQRMVYKAIWEELQTTVHAVDQMVTKTPSEAGLE